MSHYKASKSKQRGGMLVGIFVGLVLGAVFAAVVVWYVNKMPIPFIAHNKTQQTTLIQSDGAPKPLPGKPGDPSLTGKPNNDVDAATEKQRFAFYKDLESGKGMASTTGTAPTASQQPSGATPAATTPPSATPSATTPPAATPSSTTPPGASPAASAKESVVLQAGSFLDMDEADNQRVRLMLMGVDAQVQVQQVMLQDKVWYRVRLGPLQSQDEAAKLRTELARNGIEAVVVK